MNAAMRNTAGWMREHGTLAAVLCAGWPVWSWYAGRLGDPADDHWEILALVTALVLLVRTRRRMSPDERWLILPALLLTTYLGTYQSLPPLARATIMVLVLGSVLAIHYHGQPWHAGLWGLLFLSLPVLPTAQFFAGYPLRVAATFLATPLLGLNGYTVVTEGVVMRWNNVSVLVDGPCSGVKMLWAGMYLTLTLATALGVSNGRTIICAVLAIAIVILSNALRAATLFFVETGITPTSAWMHDALGMVVFLLGGIAILFVVSHMSRSRKVRVGP